MVISTHQTADIITLFDTIVVIDAGRMLWRRGLAQFFAMAPDEFSGTDRAGAAFAQLVGEPWDR
ncbi:MAG: hypothetical protein LKI77_08715 [Bifidobacterium sp.]|jgi:ABC-type multidrug transport system ATPase subunit|nr:hypothetical protein [Bifidobacterium sp.]